VVRKKSVPLSLLIDNSNSRTKATLATPEALAGDVRVHPTPDLDAAALTKLTQDWSFDRVLVSTVVPEKQQLITNSFGPDITLAVSHDIELGIDIDFPNPATIGADRLANAAAVSALYHTPAVVIDFGTAVTFDIVSGPNGRRPAYIGGVIAPGLDVMTDYLHQRTALLPKIDLIEPPTIIGKSTTDAMLAGVVHGYRGLIKEIIAEIIVEIDEKTPTSSNAPEPRANEHAPSGSSSMPAVAGVTLVATGGYAGLIAAKLDLIQTVHQNLTLDGLRIIANLNP
jgi:type III pantothenate kinase